MRKAMEKAGFEIHSVENISIHYSDDHPAWHDNWLKQQAADPQGLRRALVPHLAPLPRLVVAHRRAGQRPGFQVVAHKNLDSFDRKMFIGRTVGGNLHRVEREKRSSPSHRPERQRNGARGIDRRFSLERRSGAPDARSPRRQPPVRSIGVIRCPAERRERTAVSTVAEDDGGVAREAGSARALEGRPCESASQAASSSERSCSRPHARPALERRERIAVVVPERRARGRAGVERTHGLAVVAAEEVVADPFAQARDGSRLRCSIVRYETQRRGSRTKGASNAPVGHASRQRVQAPQRSVIGCRGRARSVVTTSPRRTIEPAPGTMSSPVLADEAQPRASRPGALEHRRVVAERPRVHGVAAGPERANEGSEASHPLAQETVVVAAPGIARDGIRASSCASFSCPGGRW